MIRSLLAARHRWHCSSIASIVIAGGLACDPAIADNLSFRTIEVSDDAGNSVVAIIEDVGSSPPPDYIATTRKGGKVVLPSTYSCREHHRIRVRVESGRYYPRMIDRTDCTEPLKVKLTSWSTLAALGAKTEELSKIANYAAAALVASDLAARLASIDTETLRVIVGQADTNAAANGPEPAVRSYLEIELKARTTNDAESWKKTFKGQAFEYAAKAFDVDDPTYFDRRSGLVLSSKFGQTITAYQAGHNLTATGKLDHDTLTKVAGGTLSQFIGSWPAPQL